MWLYGAGMTGLFGIVAESCLGRRGKRKEERGGDSLSAWIAAPLFVSSGLWLEQLAPEGWLTTVAIVMALVAGAFLLALREAVSGDSSLAKFGRFVANLLLFLLVFVLFALIYQTKERALFTATGTGLVALIASMELLRNGPERRVDWSVAILSGVAALLIAETTWVLGYWPVGGLVGGALLLLGYYVLVGLLQCIRDNSLGRSTVLEYGAVGIVGFLAILVAVP